MWEPGKDPGEWGPAPLSVCELTPSGNVAPGTARSSISLRETQNPLTWKKVVKGKENLSGAPLCVPSGDRSDSLLCHILNRACTVA